MKKFYKNTINFNDEINPSERRRDISKEIIRHSDYIPKTLTYEDIDTEFKQWVEDKINIIQDGVKLPTMALYSNQRFSEYMQTWTYTDNNNNIRLNFKTVTRENNPSHGTIMGDSYNIPGERFYTFKSIPAIDENGKRYRLDYKMRQPTPVDLVYKVSVMTNRYTTLNEFNETVNQIFNAKQSYISPNGYYMSLILENISDESEYNIEDRQFFSQNFTVKIKGYIIREDDFKVEENPVASIICFEGDTTKRRKPLIELYEYDSYFTEERTFEKMIDIDVDLSFCFPYKGKIKFTIDEDIILTKLTFKEPNNIVEDTVKLYVNDELITDNLLKYAFEGYIKCDYTPEDANKDNTLVYDLLPKQKIRLYKYIKYENNYYKWNSISFFNGDEITIQTEQIKRYQTTGGLILSGHNRFNNEIL